MKESLRLSDESLGISIDVKVKASQSTNVFTGNGALVTVPSPTFWKMVSAKILYQCSGCPEWHVRARRRLRRSRSAH